MAHPPFINSTGLIPKIFEKITEAQTPTRFTQDFLSTKLGFASSSARPIIPMLKRLGFLSNDGAPTELYSRFRNASERGGAMAAALRAAYSDLYERNEYAHELTRERLRDLVIQVTGSHKDNSVVPAIVGTFQALKEYADFDAPEAPTAREKAAPVVELQPVTGDRRQEERRETPRASTEDGFTMSLGYTINLNLPESTNPDVFNAIFRALKENLLKR